MTPPTDPASHASAGTVSGVFAGPVRALRSPRRPGDAPTRWQSAIVKSAVTGSARVTSAGLAGDAQKVLKHHGGPTKAVLVYGAAHYAQWADSLGVHAAAHTDTLRAMSAEVDASHFGPGAFGENLTIDGLTEATVFLGDLWQIGGCHLRITEPRAPCATLARRWLRPSLIAEVTSTAAAGWYNRVEKDGDVTVGDRATLVERVQHEWSLARVFHLLEARVVRRSELLSLHASAGVHAGLLERLDRRLRTPGRVRENVAT